MLACFARWQSNCFRYWPRRNPYYCEAADGVPQEISMKRIVASGVLIMALGLIPTVAHAAPLATATFCSATGTPGVNEASSCVVGLEASLELNLVDLTSRTYTMTLTMDTSSALFPDATYQFIQQ